MNSAQKSCSKCYRVHETFLFSIVSGRNVHGMLSKHFRLLKKLGKLYLVQCPFWFEFWSFLTFLHPKVCIETLFKRATSVAHLTNFSFEFFYEIFTEDASLLRLYHLAKKSKMTKNSNQGGPALTFSLPTFPCGNITFLSFFNFFSIGEVTLFHKVMAEKRCPHIYWLKEYYPFSCLFIILFTTLGRRQPSQFAWEEKG